MYHGKRIIENSDVSQLLVLISFIQNHSAITQRFYVTMSSSLKPLVHDLLCTKMLRALLPRRAEKSVKNFLGSPGSCSQPPYLPIPLLMIHIQKTSRGFKHSNPFKTNQPLN